MNGTCFKFWPMKNIFVSKKLIIVCLQNYQEQLLPSTFCWVRSEFMSSFMSSFKRYPTSLEKISILTWRLLVMSSQKFSCKLNFSRLISAKYFISATAALKVISTQKMIIFENVVFEAQFISSWYSYAPFLRCWNFHILSTLKVVT